MILRELRLAYSTVERRAPAFDASTPLATPASAVALLRPILEDQAQEIFVVLCLTTKHRPIGWTEVSRGTLDATLVHPREAFKAAILANANCVILAHNHPSGDPAPSPDDLATTTRLATAGEILGIPVLDHLIIGHEGRYYSFKESQRL